MKNILIGTLLALQFSSCQPNSTEANAAQATTGGESFTPQQVDGKWTTDFVTAQELKGLRNTIENFTQLNKKKYENLQAYQEFGDLLRLHINRINSNSQLEGDTKEALLQKLNKIADEANVLSGESMELSKEALMQINLHLAAIDSSFNYMN